MLQKFKRLICRHSYAWSERRHREVCYLCGHARDPEPDSVRPRSDAASTKGEGQAG